MIGTKWRSQPEAERDRAAEPRAAHRDELGVVHVLADKAPDPGFAPVEGGLEDVYFSTLTASRKAA